MEKEFDELDIETYPIEIQRLDAVQTLVDKFTKEGTPLEVKKKVRDAILFILNANIHYQAETFYIQFKPL